MTRPQLRLSHRYFLAIMLLATVAMVAAAAALIVQYERSMAEVRQTSSRTFAQALRDQFMDLCDDLNADGMLDPIKT